ncbi:MAG: HPr family phosphocarrier protein [Lachnospiraceae bacterium]|nr:HPr family phosphocarrier protein [Lachnospiraceae bacterium]
MREVNVSLETIEKVKGFVSITTKCNRDLDLVSGRYMIDAKSILGIFTMDLSKPLVLKIHAEKSESEEILEELKGYVVG